MRQVYNKEKEAAAMHKAIDRECDLNREEAPVTNPLDLLVSRQDILRGATVIDDGCGNQWINYCYECNEHGTLEIVRPGKVQCGSCG